MAVAAIQFVGKTCIGNDRFQVGASASWCCTSQSKSSRGQSKSLGHGVWSMPKRHVPAVNGADVPGTGAEATLQLL